MNPEETARDRYLSRAGIPAQVKTYSIDDIASSYVREACHLLVDRLQQEVPDPRGLLLYGPPGTGKTTAAATVLREVLSTASHAWLGRCAGHYTPTRPGYFIGYANLIRLHHKTFRKTDDAEQAQQLLDSLYYDSFRSWENCRILVLDDVGREHSGGTGFTSNVLHDILRTRFAAGAPTIVTTNFDPDQWEAAYGDATASFIHEAFHVARYSGKDRRRG